MPKRSLDRWYIVFVKDLVDKYGFTREQAQSILSDNRDRVKDYFDRNDYLSELTREIANQYTPVSEAAPIPEKTLQTVMANIKCVGKPGKVMQHYSMERRNEIFDELERRGWIEPNSINLTPLGNEVSKDWLDLCQY